MDMTLSSLRWDGGHRLAAPIDTHADASRKQALARHRSDRESLVEPPLNTGDASFAGIGEGFEENLGEVDGFAGAAHALIDHGGGGRLAVKFDRDGFPAVRVAVALGTHHPVRQCDDVVRLPVVGPSTRSDTGGVVRDVTGTRRRCGAFAGAGAPSG